jgi:DNA-directed RNA polymerase subunit RPC12/RpoP
MIKTRSVRRFKLHGVGVRTKPTNRVAYVCPRCGADRDGTVVEQQRWYHVLAIPCVPLATLDSAVDCDTCGHRASLAVLEVLTASALSDYLATAMRYATASMVKASIDDGDGITTEMLDEVFDLMILSGYEYDELTLANDLSAVDESALAGALRPLVDELTPHGKQGFLHRMVAIALADGALTRSEQVTLVQIGVDLGMAAPHINGVLATAVTHYQAAA